MRFQIISKTSGIILSDDLSINDILNKVMTYFQEFESFVYHSDKIKEKEFLIKPLDPRDTDLIKANPQNFTIIVRRTQ